MRRRRPIASLFVLLLATLTMSAALGGSASAAAVSTCASYGEPPHLRVGGTRLYATGTFRCAEAALGMQVTVCIEEQYAVDSPWYSRGCTTVKDLYEYRSSVEATHSMYVPVYGTFLRTTVTGVNARGDRVVFSTPPIFWFNCACYIG